METLLQGIPGVVVYLDDVLITGKRKEEHLKSLEAVLVKMSEAGLKCLFIKESVTYLIHVIDACRLHPIQEKVESLKEAPSPRNLTQLKSYLGLLTYYGRFLPNLSHDAFCRLLRPVVANEGTEKSTYRTSFTDGSHE